MARNALHAVQPVLTTGTVRLSGKVAALEAARLVELHGAGSPPGLQCPRASPTW